MGELRQMKRLFDLPRPSEIDFRNIDHVAGVLFVAIKRSAANLPDDAIVARVDAVAKVDFELEPGDEGYESEADPTPAPDAALSDSPEVPPAATSS